LPSRRSGPQGGSVKRCRIRPAGADFRQAKPHWPCDGANRTLLTRRAGTWWRQVVRRAASCAKRRWGDWSSVWGKHMRMN